MGSYTHSSEWQVKKKKEIKMQKYIVNEMLKFRVPKRSIVESTQK